MATEAKLTVGDRKVKFNEAMGAAYGIDPRHCQIPMPTQSFVNEVLTSTTLAMNTPSYQYTRIWALGFDTLCELFLSAGCSSDCATKVRSSLYVAFDMVQEDVEADCAALKALSEGVTEEQALALEDLVALSKQKVTYDYTFGTGLATLMKQASVPPSEEVIARWCDALNLSCKSVFTRDYKYFESSVEKFAQMKEMMAQMEISAKRDAAKREAEKAEKAAGDA
jgi:hypothetical protein